MKGNNTIKRKMIAATLALIMAASPVGGSVFASSEAPEENPTSVTVTEEIEQQAEKKEAPAEENKKEKQAAVEEKAAPAAVEEKAAPAAVEEKAAPAAVEEKAAPAAVEEKAVPEAVEEKAAPAAVEEKAAPATVEEKATPTVVEEKAEAPKAAAETQSVTEAPKAETAKEETAAAPEEKPVKRASSYKVTVMLTGIKNASGAEETATLSYTVSVSGSKTIAASTLNAKVKTKSVKIDGVTYKFQNLWRDASGNEVSSIYINGDDLWGPTELTYRAVYSAVPDKKVTVNFKNILKADGTAIDMSESNTLSEGVGWNFTQKKLDNKIPAKSFSVNGTKYEYAGKWVDDNGVEFTSISIKNADLEGDTVLNFYPVYNITETKKLRVNYIDGISTASGSWANIDEFTSYTHTMKQPDAQKHYQFISWKNDETGEEYLSGDKISIKAADLTEANTEININAYWQPSVTVRYHFNGEVIEKESFEDINVYGQAAEIDGIAYDGWYSAEGEMLAEDAAYDAPAATTKKVERTVYDVYARRPVTVSAASKTWTYDGEEHSDDTVSITAGGIFEGDEIEAVVSGSVAKVSDGEVANAIESIRIMRGGQDVSGYYNITAADGLLSIAPVSDKVTVSIKENSASEKYDGTEKSVNGYEVSIDNDLYTEDDFSFGGVAEAKGTEAGRYDMMVEASDFTNNNDNFSNVEFVVEDGALTIEAAPAPVVPAAPVDPKTPAAPAAEPKTPAAPAAEPKTPAAPVAEPKTSAAPAATVKATPAAAQTAPAAQEEEAPTATVSIDNAATPAAAPATIVDSEAPLASFSAWALLNLIMTIVTGLISAVLLAGWFGKKNEDEEADNEEDSTRRKGFVRVSSLIPAIGSIIAFILTENMNNPMVFTDRWTILMAVILVIQAAVAILAKKEDKEDEDNEAAEAINA